MFFALNSHRKTFVLTLVTAIGVTCVLGTDPSLARTPKKRKATTKRSVSVISKRGTTKRTGTIRGTTRSTRPTRSTGISRNKPTIRNGVTLRGKPPVRFTQPLFSLEVQQLSGEFSKWGTTHTINQPLPLMFRFAMKRPGAVKAQYQVSTLPLSSKSVSSQANGIISTGMAGPTKLTGMQVFKIDFSKLIKTTPGKRDGTRTFYVRIVGIDNSGKAMTGPSNLVTIKQVTPNDPTQFSELVLSGVPRIDSITGRHSQVIGGNSLLVAGQGFSVRGRHFPAKKYLEVVISRPGKTLARFPVDRVINGPNNQTIVEATMPKNLQAGGCKLTVRVSDQGHLFYQPSNSIWMASNLETPVRMRLKSLKCVIPDDSGLRDEAYVVCYVADLSGNSPRTRVTASPVKKFVKGQTQMFDHTIWGLYGDAEPFPADPRNVLILAFLMENDNSNVSAVTKEVETIDEHLEDYVRDGLSRDKIAQLLKSDLREAALLGADLTGDIDNDDPIGKVYQVPTYRVDQVRALAGFPVARKVTVTGPHYKNDKGQTVVNLKYEMEFELLRQ